MYGVIRRFNVMEGQTHRVLTQIQQGYAREVATLQGFVSYHIIDGGDGTLVSSSLFQTKADADAAQHHAAAWVKEHIARMLKIAPVIVSGEVKVQATRPQAEQPGPADQATAPKHPPRPEPPRFSALR